MQRRSACPSSIHHRYAAYGRSATRRSVAGHLACRLGRPLLRTSLLLFPLIVGQPSSSAEDLINSGPRKWSEIVTPRRARVISHGPSDLAMAQTLLNTIRRHQHQPAFRRWAVLLLVWFAFGCVPCAGQIVTHPVPTVSSCQAAFAGHHHATTHHEQQPVVPPGGGCILKACLEHSFDLRAWAGQPTTLPTVAPLLAPLILALLPLLLFRRLRLHSASVPPSPSIGLIYRFCSLLN